MIRTRRWVSALLILGFLAACGQGSPAPGATPGDTVTIDASTSIAAGRIQGLRLGDTLDRCLALAGEPSSQSGGGDAPVILYNYPQRGLRVEFESASKSITALALVLGPDELLRDLASFTPQADVLATEEWAAYRSNESVDRWVKYDLPAFHAWILSSPDGRRTHAVLLTVKGAPAPEVIQPPAPPAEPVISVIDVPAPDPGSEPITSPGTSAVPSSGRLYTDVLVGGSGWEQGQVFSPAIRAVASGLQMGYVGGRSSNNVGFASSRDGLTWTRDRNSPLPLPDGYTMATSPTWLPGIDQLLTLVHNSAGRVAGSHSWVQLPDKTWSPRSIVLRSGDGAGYDHYCCVKIGGKFYLYYHVTGTDGRTRISRCESEDGTRWSNHQVVFEPSAAGFDAGHVSCPNLFFDATTRTWTLWYNANGAVSGSESVLGRATSRDGLHFTNRQLFLRPQALDPSFALFGSPVEATTPSGSFLYVAVRGPSVPFKIIRINIRDPHTASRPAGTRG